MNRRNSILALAALLLMGATAGGITFLKSRQHLGKPGVKVSADPGPSGLKIDLPLNVAGFASEEADASAERAALPSHTTIAKRFYRGSDGFNLWLSVVLMESDRTSIHRPEFCLKGQGWEIDPDRTRLDAVEIHEPRFYHLPVKRMITTKSGKDQSGNVVTLRGLYVYWFVADGQVTADDKDRMRSMAVELLKTGELQRWAYVSCFVVCPPGQEDAMFQRVDQFIALAVPQFQLATGVKENASAEQSHLHP